MSRAFSTLLWLSPHPLQTDQQKPVRQQRHTGKMGWGHSPDLLGSEDRKDILGLFARARLVVRPDDFPVFD